MFKGKMTLVIRQHNQMGILYTIYVCNRGRFETGKAPTAYGHNFANNLVEHIIFIDFVNKFPRPVGYIILQELS
jgi:hypothetical protein